MITNVLKAGCGSAIVLLIEHVVLYEKISRTDAYAVGVSTIGAGLAGYALLRPAANAAEMVAAFAGVSIICGMTVKAAYHVRHFIETQNVASGGLTAYLIPHKRPTSRQNSGRR